MDNTGRRKAEDQVRFNALIERNYLVDPEMPQDWYDSMYVILIMRNYNPADNTDTEVRIGTEVMLEHVDVILQHPDLFS